MPVMHAKGNAFNELFLFALEASRGAGIERKGRCHISTNGARKNVSHSNRDTRVYKHLVHRETSNLGTHERELLAYEGKREER